MCGDFRLKTQDNSVILCGHSMQFPISQTSELITFNRGERFESKAPDGTKGKEWVSKYGFTGINAFHIDAPDTAMNEAGLAFSVLVMRGTEYPNVPKDEYPIALGMMDVSNYLLSLCATVEDVKKALSNVRIYGQFIKQMDQIPGLHIALHDAEGNDAVVEFVDGEVKFYDNPNGVLTNDPPLPQQLENLKKYENLVPTDGMMGMPGSWKAVDRFVRLSLEVQKAKTTCQKDALDNAVKILNASDLPNGVEVCEFVNKTFTITTLWQSIMDLKEKIFYFRPHGDPTFRVVDLKRLNLDAGTKHERIPVHTNTMTLIDLTERLNPPSIYNYMSGKNPVNPLVAELTYPIHQTQSVDDISKISTNILNNDFKEEIGFSNQEAMKII